MSGLWLLCRLRLLGGRRGSWWSLRGLWLWSRCGRLRVSPNLNSVRKLEFTDAADDRPEPVWDGGHVQLLLEELKLGLRAGASGAPGDAVLIGMVHPLEDGVNVGLGQAFVTASLAAFGRLDLGRDFPSLTRWIVFHHLGGSSKRREILLRTFSSQTLDVKSFWLRLS